MIKRSDFDCRASFFGLMTNKLSIRHERVAKRARPPKMLTRLSFKREKLAVVRKFTSVMDEPAIGTEAATILLTSPNLHWCSPLLFRFGLIVLNSLMEVIPLSHLAVADKALVVKFPYLSFLVSGLQCLA